MRSERPAVPTHKRHISFRPPPCPLASPGFGGFRQPAARPFQRLPSGNGETREGGNTVIAAKRQRPRSGISSLGLGAPSGGGKNRPESLMQRRLPNQRPRSGNAEIPVLPYCGNTGLLIFRPLEPTDWGAAASDDCHRSTERRPVPPLSGPEPTPRSGPPEGRRSQRGFHDAARPRNGRRLVRGRVGDGSRARNCSRSERTRAPFFNLPNWTRTGASPRQNRTRHHEELFRWTSDRTMKVLNKAGSTKVAAGQGRFTGIALVDTLTANCRTPESGPMLTRRRRDSSLWPREE